MIIPKNLSITDIWAIHSLTVCLLAGKSLVLMAGDTGCKVVPSACEDVTFWKTRGVMPSRPIRARKQEGGVASPP